MTTTVAFKLMSKSDEVWQAACPSEWLAERDDYHTKKVQAHFDACEKNKKSGKGEVRPAIFDILSKRIDECRKDATQGPLAFLRWYGSEAAFQNRDTNTDTTHAPEYLTFCELGVFRILMESDRTVLFKNLSSNSYAIFLLSCLQRKESTLNQYVKQWSVFVKRKLSPSDESYVQRKSSMAAKKKIKATAEKEQGEKRVRDDEKETLADDEDLLDGLTFVETAPAVNEERVVGLEKKVECLEALLSQSERKRVKLEKKMDFIVDGLKKWGIVEVKKN